MTNPLHLVSSLFLVIMAAITLLHWLVTPSIPLWISGACGWLGLITLLVSSAKSLFKQFFILSAVGLGFLGWAMTRDAELPLHRLLVQNNSLIVMLYCVGFLRLVASSAETDEELPKGALAYLKTLLGIHLLGAVINASILVLSSERLKSQNALNRRSLTVIARAFSMAALWSPFFAAMAVALTYAEGAELVPLMLTGLVLTVIAMTITILEQGGRGLSNFDEFRGYPTHLSNLMIPLLLATSVFVFHYLYPDLPVLMLVSATALVLTLVFVLQKQGAHGGGTLVSHIKGSAPRMTRELSLFMGAGVLTVGLQAFFGTVEGILPFDEIAAGELSILLAISIGVSLVGVHPIITVAIIGPMVQPLQPEPNHLAILFLATWSFGVIANPYSGVNTILRGQWDAGSRQLIRWNLPYVVMMWVVVSGVFWVIE